MGSDFAIFDVPGHQKQRNTVFDCAEEGEADALGKMVRGSRHFDVDAKDRYGRTILMWGCDKGHVEVVEKCLDLGAKHEIKEAVTGRTAVHWAARMGSAEIIQLLVNVGAEVLSSDKYGMNPLFLAMQKGEEGEAAVQLLMELGAVHTCVKKHHEILSSMTPEEQEQLHDAEHHTGPTGKTSNTTRPVEAKPPSIANPAEAKTSSFAKPAEVKSPSIAKPADVKSMTPEEQEQLHNAKHHTGPTEETSNTTKSVEGKTSSIAKPAEVKSPRIAEPAEVKSPGIAKPTEVKSPSIAKPTEADSPSTTKPADIPYISTTIQKDFSKDSFILKAIPKYVPKDVSKGGKV